MRKWFFKILACLFQKKNKASLKILTVIILYESRIKFLSRLHWSIFSSVLYSKPTFGTNFRITGGFLNNFLLEKAAWTISLKKATGRISQLISDFTEESRNLTLDFLHKKTVKNCDNHKLFLGLLIKISARDTNPLRVKGKRHWPGWTRGYWRAWDQRGTVSPSHHYIYYCISTQTRSAPDT